MSDLPALKSLLERVEKATGPDRELDGAIWRETIGFDPDRMLPQAWPDIGQPPSPFPPLTASLDASLSLVNEMLPGGIVTITTTGLADILVASETWIKSPPLRTPPLAVLSALLRALDKDGGGAHG